MRNCISSFVQVGLVVMTLYTGCLRDIQVVEELQHYSVAYFACYRSTDHLDPSKSRPILQKREKDALEQDRLTVGRISELNLSHARIAYFLACSTAQNRASQLSDKVIHVVSGP